MRRLARVTLALILAVALDGPAPATFAGATGGTADRPLWSQILERLLGPFRFLGGGGGRGTDPAPPRAVQAGSEQDGGPERDPNGVAPPGGQESDPDGLAPSGTTPPPSVPAEAEQDGGPERDPDG